MTLGQLGPIVLREAIGPAARARVAVDDDDPGWRQTTMMARWAVLVLSVAGGVLYGCSRRAPAPAECLEMAARWNGLESLGRPLPEHVAASVESLTLRCIDEPFAPELVRCINGGHSKAMCAAVLTEARAGDY